MKKIKTWATFFTNGIIIASTWSVDQEEGIIPEDVEWPGNAYAFTLNKRTDIIEGDDVFKGKSEQIGPMYYHPDSVVATLEEVKEDPKASSILIKNMECNGWDKIVWSRYGNWPRKYTDGESLVLKKKK